MKLLKRQVISALVLLFLVIIGILWIITSDSITWPSVFSIIIAVISVVGTFSQWLFPLSTDKVSISSDGAKQNNNQGTIIVGPFQRKKLEEQKTQASNQKNREKRKKRNGFIISISSAILSVLSIVVFIFLQLSPQIYFITSDNDYKSRVTSIAWSPNGRLVASTTQDGSVRIWNVAKGVTSLIYLGQNQNMYNTLTKVYNNISWSPNGKYIAFGNNDDKIRIADVSNPQSHSFIYLDAGNSEIVNTVVWSPDGNYIAFGGENAIVYVKKFNTMQTIITYSNTAPISTLAWSRSGKFIASAGSDGEVHVWSVATGKDVFNTPNYSGVVTVLAWSPTSSSLIASASSDSQVDVWDISKGYAENPIVAYKKHAGSVNSVAWSPDGNYIVSGGDEGNLSIWDAVTGKDLSTYQEYLHPMLRGTSVVVSAVGWSFDDKSIAIGHSEYGENGGYQSYYTVEVIKFCKSWCLFQ